jgi:hypothetical protein
MRGNASLLGVVSVVLSFALILATVTPLPTQAQAASQAGKGARKTDNFNPPPFDFNDAFYLKNGVDVEKLNSSGARFGIGNNRLTGPPAGQGQVNWVVDNTNTDPDRKNVRILATTGGYKDDTGSPTQFISIIAFLNDQTFFTPANQHGGTGNARHLAMQDIAGMFEAYVGLKQVDAGGVFRPTPCASIGDPAQVAAGNCFSVASVETPNLRQDWRFSTNRSAIDGSAQLSYNGDNLLGLWIITYFWYNANGFGTTQTSDCKAALNFLAARNGLTLDGTPLIKTGAELHFIEGAFQGNEGRDFPPPPGVACGAEGNLAFGGSDKGPVWLVCPSLPDPTHGGIAPDAFVDTVRRPNGTPLDSQISASFDCLQKNGQFCALANGTYMVKNQTSGLFWDGTSPGGSAVQLDALNTGPTGTSQSWKFTANPNGSYKIINQASGLALTAGKSSSGALTQIQADGDSDQDWIVAPLNKGFRITNASSKLAVDATSDTPNPGASIIQATPNGETRQVWVIH